MYDEIIYLATEVKTDVKDEYGDTKTELKKEEVFAELRSIGQKEFYQAQTLDKKPEIKFVIPDYLDYSDQEYVIYNEVRYKVLRTYRTNENELEITCYGGVRDASA